MSTPTQCDLILARLQRGEASTWDLMDCSGSLAVHSRISEIRARGVQVEHRKAVRVRADGVRRRIDLYRLVSAPGEQQDARTRKRSTARCRVTGWLVASVLALALFGLPGWGR